MENAFYGILPSSGERKESRGLPIPATQPDKRLANIALILCVRNEEKTTSNENRYYKRMKQRFAIKKSTKDGVPKF